MDASTASNRLPIGTGRFNFFRVRFILINLLNPLHSVK
jgi:hypothetical protein